jgi:hypothetical protein
MLPNLLLIHKLGDSAAVYDVAAVSGGLTLEALIEPGTSRGLGL